MILNTKYHGNREYEEKEVIVFNNGLPGFEELKKYILFDLDGNNMFSILHSIEDTSLGFVLISPFLVVKEYEFEINEDIEKDINIEKIEDLIILNTVNVNSDPNKMTTNLKAPIVINTKNNLGEQIILTDEKYSLRQPLLK